MQKIKQIITPLSIFHIGIVLLISGVFSTAQSAVLLGKDTLRITNVVGDTIVAPNNRITLTVTIKNTGTVASQTNRRLQIYQVKSACSWRCCGCRVEVDSMSNAQVISRAINPNDSITLPLTFTMSPNFTHKDHYEPYIPLKGLAVGFEDAKSFVYYGADPNFDTLFCYFPLKALLPTAKLAISATPLGAFTQRDSTIRYVVTVQNVGTSLIRSVETQLFSSGNPIYTTQVTADKGTTTTLYANSSNSNNRSTWNVDTLQPNEAARCTAQLKSIVFYYSSAVEMSVKTQSIYYDNALAGTATVQFVKAPTGTIETTLTTSTITLISPYFAKNDVVLSVKTSAEQVLNIYFFNTIGQLVKTQTNTVQGGDTTLTIDVNDLPSGYYVIRTKGKDAQFVPLRFVKL